jgi:hypothetical protein
VHSIRLYPIMYLLHHSCKPHMADMQKEPISIIAKKEVKRARQSVVVDGVVYTSNAALQVAWRSRVKKYCTAKSRKIPQQTKVSDDDVAWFMDICEQCPSHKVKLKNATIATVIPTMVVDRSDAGFRPSKDHESARRTPGISKHMKFYPCVFVMDKKTGRLRSLPNKLDMRETKADTGRIPTYITNWMRSSVESQIDEFRSVSRLNNQMDCHICKKSVEKRKSHVDHGTGERSFRSIARAFVVSQDLKMPAMDKLTSKIGSIFRHQWSIFHRKHAILSMSCATCNLTNK